MTASYAWNESWKGGISIGLTLGSLSDQTDPRPKTNTTVLPIYVGTEHRLNSQWALGATAGISFYNSDIAYTLVNTLNSHRYFLMKGMGDYYRISSGDVSGYQRAYKGLNYTGALQLVWEPEHKNTGISRKSVIRMFRKKLQTEVLPINFTEETTLRMNGCYRTVSSSPLTV